MVDTNIPQRSKQQTPSSKSQTKTTKQPTTLSVVEPNVPPLKPLSSDFDIIDTNIKTKDPNYVKPLPKAQVPIPDTNTVLREPEYTLQIPSSFDWLSYDEFLANSNGTLQFDTITYEYLTKLQYTLLADSPSKNDKYLVYQFLIHPSYQIQRSYTGLDINGHQYVQEFVIPSELLHPKEFTLSDYPLSPNQRSFALDRQYDYLVTFRSGSIKVPPTATPIQVKVINGIKDVMCRRQAQSRFSKIWREMTSVIFALDLKFGHTNYFIRHVLTTLFSSPTGFRFYEDNLTQSFIFTDDSTPSIMPTLAYGLMQLGVAIMTGMMTEIESVVGFQYYCECAKTSYQDNKLRWKSKLINWLTEAELLIGPLPTLRWTRSVEIADSYLKVLHTTPLRLSFIKEAQESRKSLPSTITKYISHVLSKVKDIRMIRRYYMAMRFMANEGTYVDTLDELALDAAVQPIVTETIVEPPVPSLISSDNTVYDQNFDTGLWRRIQDYYTPYVSPTAHQISRINLEQKWLATLTTSSSGTKTPAELAILLTKSQAISAKTRLVMQAYTAPKFRDLSTLYQALAEDSYIGARTQTGRRRRNINQVRNERLFLTNIPYLVGVITVNFHDDAALGKQAGNALDLKHLLLWTGTPTVLISSADVSGMDASTQNATKEIFSTFVLKVLSSKMCRHERYGPFSRRPVVMINTNHEQITVDANALWQAFALYKRNTQTSAVFNSKIFDRITNQEGAFPSGVLHTSIHHTFILTMLTRAVEQLQIESGIPTRRVGLNVLGDDFIGFYLGTPDAVDYDAKADVDGMSELGFKTTLEISEYHGTFLQQMVAGGTFWGFPERVTLLTREKRTERLSLSDSSKELLALVDDMLHRVNDEHGLHVLTFSISLFSILRHTVEIQASRERKFLSILQTFGFNYLTYAHKSQRQPRKTTLVTIFPPISWLFHKSGGSLPSFPFQRADSTFTVRQSLTAPRGDVLRRLYFDISNIQTMHLERSLFLDAQQLNKYNFHATEIMCLIDKANLRDEYALANLDQNIVLQLGTNLEKISTPGKWKQSRDAYERLRLAFDIPVHLVTGLKEFKRIEESLIQGTALRDVSVKYITDRLFEKIQLYISARAQRINGIKTYVYPLERDDAYHAYLLTYSNVPIQYNQCAQHLQHIDLASSLEYGTKLWYLLTIIGTPNLTATQLRVELAAVRGSYQRFSYDDPVFRHGLRIYMSDRSYMRDFYIAIDASPDYKIALEKAFQYFLDYGHISYPYTLSPRQLMFLNDSPASSLNLIVQDSSLDQHYRSLQLTYGYISALSYPDALNRYKWNVVLHPDMFKYKTKLQLRTESLD